MRTRSGAMNTDKPSSSRGHINMTDPPLADAVASLMNVSADNARILQTWAQYGVPISQGHLDHETTSTYCDFLNTHPPIFHKAEQPLEAEYWICTIEQKFGLIHCSDIQKTLFVVQQL